MLSVVGPAGQKGVGLLAEARVKDRSAASDLCFPRGYPPKIVISPGSVGLPFPLDEQTLFSTVQPISTLALPPKASCTPIAFCFPQNKHQLLPAWHLASWSRASYLHGISP